MTYLKPRKTSLSMVARSWIAAGFAILAFIIIAQVFWPHMFATLFNASARPFWRMQTAVRLGALSSPDDLLRENAFYKREIDDLKNEITFAESVRIENEHLRALLGRASTTPRILSAVLSRPPSSGYDTLTIDVGLRDGCAVGNIVYGAGGLPLGRIAEVYSETSKIILNSSPGETHEVMIGAGKTAALASGRGGGQYQAEVPREAPVAVGDLVTLPAATNVPFGLVKSVSANVSQTFKTILFASPVSVYSLEWVTVDTHIHG